MSRDCMAGYCFDPIYLWREGEAHRRGWPCGREECVQDCNNISVSIILG